MPCEEVKEGRRVRRVHTALIVKWTEGRGGRAHHGLQHWSGRWGQVYGVRELGEDQSTQEKEGERVQAHTGR